MAQGTSAESKMTGSHGNQMRLYHESKTRASTHTSEQSLPVHVIVNMARHSDDTKPRHKQGNKSINLERTKTLEQAKKQKNKPSRNHEVSRL